MHRYIIYLSEGRGEIKEKREKKDANGRRRKSFNTVLNEELLCSEKIGSKQSYAMTSLLEKK